MVSVGVLPFLSDADTVKSSPYFLLSADDLRCVFLSLFAGEVRDSRLVAVRLEHCLFCSPA